VNYAENCKAKFVTFLATPPRNAVVGQPNGQINREVLNIFMLTDRRAGHILLYMSRKHNKLKQSGTLNNRPKRVSDPLFKEEEFFDPSDLAQVKYEMLRRVSHEGKSVSEAARLFGFSRPSFYKAHAALEQEGLSGLIPKKSGPRAGHKLTDEALEFIAAELERDRSLSSVALADLLKADFGTEVHPRSIERALTRKKKR